MVTANGEDVADASRPTTIRRNDPRKAFVAFPSNPKWLYETIVAGIKVANASDTRCVFHGWPDNDISGRPLNAPIQSGIAESDFIVADVTILNFNVTYEVGYAIGSNKRAILIKSSEQDNDERVSRVGIFDTLGYTTYEESHSLSRLLTSIPDTAAIDLSRPLIPKAPVYLVESTSRREAMSQILSSVKKARLQYRSFNPSEETRMAAADAIGHVSSSHGILVPLVPDNSKDGHIHNVRAAFVAGLAHGMDKPTLIIHPADTPAPLDVRDQARSYRSFDDIKGHVNSFALDVVESMQAAEPHTPVPSGGLNQLTVGDPMAENEFQTLSNYYLRRDEYDRTIAGEVNLVVGRKGAGKTALFSQVRDHLRRNPTTVVLDLKPEGFQLVKLRESVLDFLNIGAKLHLVTAFWEYLLLREVAHKLLIMDRQRHTRDHILFDKYSSLRGTYEESTHITQSDFSERLSGLADAVSEEFGARFSADKNTRLTTDDVTEIVHSGRLRDLRQRVSEYLAHKSSVWILFDNLDKGWSVPGPDEADISILRCLIDGAKKIEREMQRDGHTFNSIVFIRNDVYELLMRGTSDFGKEMRVSLDWKDPDMLREMLRLRLIQNDHLSGNSFSQIWASICVSHYESEETSQFMIDRSLMRPRNVIKMFKYWKEYAVNMHHRKIDTNDIEKGMESYSNDLLMEADQELTNIELAAADLLYYFIDEGNEFSREQLEVILSHHALKPDRYEKVIEFLLYFGFLGVRSGAQSATYIFDVAYDMKPLLVPLQKAVGGVRYVLNPAFWPALGARDSS